MIVCAILESQSNNREPVLSVQLVMFVESVVFTKDPDVYLPGLYRARASEAIRNLKKDITCNPYMFRLR